MCVWMGGGVSAEADVMGQQLNLLQLDATRRAEEAGGTCGRGNSCIYVGLVNGGGSECVWGGC